MHKQKTPEQERRSMRLLATGELEAAEKYFVGNAQALKQLEMIENHFAKMPKSSLRSTVLPRHFSWTSCQSACRVKRNAK